MDGVRTVPDPVRFLQRFASRVAASADPAAPAHADGLAHAVDPRVVRAVFTSMVELSDHGDLLQRYLALPFPGSSSTASRTPT